MQYWLRRNNIENGPFTREAIISQGLQTNDLIRLDGDSDWKPVSHFRELQIALQSAPKPKYKFTADKQLIEIKEGHKEGQKEGYKEKDTQLDKNQQSDITNNEQVGSGHSGVAGNSNSPFKRMPSALPKKKPAQTPPVDHTEVNATEKAKERARLIATNKTAGTEPLVGSAPAASNQASNAHLATSGNAHPKIQSRVQSLDEAPLREVKHHPTPKPVRTTAKPQNSHFFKEFFLPIIIIGAIGFLAWWGYKQFTAPKILATGLNGADSSEIALNEANQGADTQNSRPSAKPEGPAAIPVTHANGSSSKPTTGDSTHQVKPAKALSDSSQAKKATVQAAPKSTTAPAPIIKASEDKKDGEPPVTPTKQATAKTQQPTDKTDTPEVDQASKAPTKKATTKPPAKKAASIGDYVGLSLNKTPEPGIKNVKIKVHNTSKEDLNIAVVEIKYFDKEGKFIQGETLQTGKIGAGKSATLKIPSSKNAEKISYKVSLISGDNVYLMGR